jgi:hypothetical protein
VKSEEKIRRIKKALHYGGDTHTWEDVREGIIEGRFQVFDNDHGVCITEIMEGPRKRYLHCWIVAGELPGVMELHKEVERHGLTNDCPYMTTVGRRGWETVLPKYGWRRTGTMFKKELSNG